MQIPTGTNTVSLRHFNFPSNTNPDVKSQEDLKSIIKETDLLFPNQKTRQIVRLLRALAFEINILKTKKMPNQTIFSESIKTVLLPRQ